MFVKYVENMVWKIKLKLFFFSCVSDLYGMGELLFRSGQVKEEGGRFVGRLPWRTAVGRCHRSCYLVQSTWFNQEAEDTTANGEFRFYIFFIIKNSCGIRIFFSKKCKHCEKLLFTIHDKKNFNDALVKDRKTWKKYSQNLNFFKKSEIKGKV